MLLSSWRPSHCALCSQQSCSTLVNRLTTPPYASVPETVNISPSTPAGPVLLTPGVARCRLSLAGTKSACEYSQCFIITSGILSLDDNGVLFFCQGSREWRCFCCTFFPWREDHGLRHPGNQWTDPQAASSSAYTHTHTLTFADYIYSDTC